MFQKEHLISLSICFCVVLSACTPPAKKVDVLDLYALPSAGQPSAHPVAVDNDSYYTQPGVYKGCAQVNDAPSCGGG